MNKKFTYRDKFGSFELYHKGYIAELHISGACGARLIEHLCDSLMQIANACKPHSWGYLSLSPNVDAASPAAEDTMVEMTQKLLSNGCVVDSYYLISALSIAQTARIRKKAGITSNLNDVLFNNADDAREFLEDRIKQIHASI